VTLNRAYALCGGPEPVTECRSRVAPSTGGARLDGGAVKWTNRRLTARPWGNCGTDHPTVAAMKIAAASGTERDIKNARTQFLKLKPSDRRAALAMLKD